MTDWDFPYEASDEASESELLDRSLSVWKGWNPFKQEEDFAPIPLDLHTAASIGQYDCVRYLIQRREVDLDRKNKGGWTALMYSCYIGHDNIVNLLLDAGVATNVRNNKGQTPLTLAASCGNESVAYFLLQAGAELEARDKKGWTALFHATYSGHQNMVRFLLENGADMDAREPSQGYTPFLEAAASGHEIIVQYFLQSGINVSNKAKNGHTARSLALMYGHMKIVSLIDNHTLGSSHPVRSEPGVHGKDDLSSSDEAYHKPRHPSPRGNRSRGKGVSTQDGPQAFAKMIGNQNSSSVKAAVVPPGVKHKPQRRAVPAESTDANDQKLSQRDVTSPINIRDQRCSPESSSASRESIEYDEDGSAFSKTGALTIKSSSSSSGGLMGALGISGQNSADSGKEEVGEKSHSDPGQPSASDGSRSKSKSSKTKIKETHSHSDTGDHCSAPEKKPESSVFGNIQLGSLTSTPDQVPPAAPPMSPTGHRAPEIQHLATLLSSLGLSKYYPIFEEQDVDLQVFLSLTDNDLKEIGIKLFGPRRKMTNAIARWHSQARLAKNDLEQAYADKLEAEMQELAIQLHRACEQSEQMKAQALQERELRAVTESCLMDDRQAWQEVNRLASDTRQRCTDMHSTIGLMRQYQEELSRRLDFPNLTPTSAGPSPTSLVAALQEGLSLEPNHGPYQDSKVLPTQALLRRLQSSLEEILGQLTVVTINTDKLLGRQVEFS